MFGLSTAETATVIAASGSMLAATAAWCNAFLASRNERRRTQPIVIAHGHGERRFDGDGHWVYEAYATNEGNGPAFNVTFGIEVGGVRYGQRLEAEDDAAGNIQRVLRPNERRPPLLDDRPDHVTSWPITLTSSSLWGRASEVKRRGTNELDARRVYWARYENAESATWETRNRPGRNQPLDIHRVRLARLVRWRERQGRKKAAVRDQALNDSAASGRSP